MKQTEVILLLKEILVRREDRACARLAEVLKYEFASDSIFGCLSLVWENFGLHVSSYSVQKIDVESYQLFVDVAAFDGFNDTFDEEVAFFLTSVFDDKELTDAEFDLLINDLRSTVSDWFVGLCRRSGPQIAQIPIYFQFAGDKCFIDLATGETCSGIEAAKKLGYIVKKIPGGGDS